MQFNFAAIIEQLNARLPKSDNFAFRIARASVVPADYVFNSILPQEDRMGYHVDGGTMTITPTMLGMVPMDSPYPPMGAISTTTFFENTTKLGGQMFFPEKFQRDLISWEQSIASLGFNDGASTGSIASSINARRLEAVIGFANMVAKAHWDTNEFLRGQALTLGLLNWTYSDIPLSVNYNVPSANLPAQRTGTAAYNGSASTFWTDIRWVYTKLENPQFIMNTNTWLAIIGQAANNIRVVVNEGGVREIVRFVGTTETNSTDMRDRVRIVIYNKSGSVIKADGTLQAKPFLPDGKIICVGRATPDGFEFTQGSVANPDNDLRLGYTHIAPTIEGQGRPGPWARIFVPEARPYQLIAETAGNMLPVILNPNRLVVLDTTIT